MYYYLHVIFLFAKVYYMQFIRNFQLKYDYKHTKSIYLCTSYHNHLLVNVCTIWSNENYFSSMDRGNVMCSSREDLVAIVYYLRTIVFGRSLGNLDWGFRIRTHRQHFFGKIDNI